MTLISDLKAQVLDITLPITALDRRITREMDDIEEKGGVELADAQAAADEVQSIATHVPTVSGGTFTLAFSMADGVTFTTAAIAYDAVAATIETAIDVAVTAADEVQSLATHVPTVSGGTFTITFLLASGETFTTANIAYDAVAATIETAVDVAATSAAVAGWTNGDISVSGGDLNTNPVVFTYDGTSVAGLNHSPVTVDDALLTGGGTAGAVSTTTAGHPLVITGWTNGDISISGGDLNTNPVVVTFDGTSVADANHDLVVMDDALLTGGGSGGAITVTTSGQADRPGYTFLLSVGAIAGTVPAFGVTPTGLTSSSTPDIRPVSAETIRAVATAIADTEGNADIYDAIVAAAGV